MFKIVANGLKEAIITAAERFTEFINVEDIPQRADQYLSQEIILKKNYVDTTTGLSIDAISATGINLWEVAFVSFVFTAIIMRLINKNKKNQEFTI